MANITLYLPDAESKILEKLRRNKRFSPSRLFQEAIRVAAANKRRPKNERGNKPGRGAGKH